LLNGRRYNTRLNGRCYNTRLVPYVIQLPQWLRVLQLLFLKLVAQLPTCCSCLQATSGAHTDWDAGLLQDVLECSDLHGQQQQQQPP
jgi:hypothetical protein